MNTKKVLSTLGVGLLAVLLIVALLSFNKKEENNSSKIKVVTSFYPLYFFTSEIAGDKAIITNITPSGAEPHDYEPTAHDIANIEDSDLLVLNGEGLEGWENDIRKNINPRKTTIITAGESLTTKIIEKDGKTITDPHIWLSPILAKQMVDKIENELSNIDPDNSLYYQLNTQNLKTKLDTLDSEFRQSLATCKSKDIVTSHSAFAYLAEEYNLNQVSIAGLSPEEEPSSKQMAEISKFAKDNNVKYIFFESLISPKLSETIANEIGAKTLVLNPIEGLTENEINNGNNYFSEMRSNLTNLKIALQCI